jgi:glycosyltransferase involved in cell wall biosynthesis
LLSQVAPTFDPIEIIPNFINLADYSRINISPQPNSLIFTGSFRYFANHEAMEWFIREVYPIIQAQVPDVRLTITGDHANLPLPPASNIILTGFVKDIRPLVASSWVSLVPMQIGGGTRLKILEAMALGTPVVSTTKGAEGLEVSNGRHLLIGDTSQEFADRVIRLIKDQQLRMDIVNRARQFVQEKYDWAVIMPRFESLVERIGTV